MISVVIPTLNEAKCLASTIEALKQENASSEIIVVDGGSIDETVEIARQFSVRLYQATRHRARQMNLGASHASGDILFFLHADTRLPENGLTLISKALANSSVVGGAFQRIFDSRSLILHGTCMLARVRNSLIGWHLGDQGIFVRKNVFEALGGFPEIPRFEDLELSRKMGKVGKLVTLSPPVISSARRFEKEGPALRSIKDFFLKCQYLLTGVSNKP
ncbi:MAG: TIGR04283 family arsenosugar biosynthesis glycosyltransferase [Verrucomicrobiota bacterium]|nr:TIGR04283 family arsenosugar biosynthesis glycosyltransferase [Verrucomicrobiota bacterium]